MSFSKAVQVTNAEALMEFVTAQQIYKKACSVMARVRLELIGSDSSDETVVKFHHAKKLFSQQCKEYNTARGKYINSVRFAAAQLPQITNDELLGITIETNEKAIHETVRAEAIRSSIPQEDFEMARRVMKERAEAKVAQEKLDSGDFTEVESEFDNGFDKL
jgi:ERCC4-type nuclease